jgi:hypothetical protein
MARREPEFGLKPLKTHFWLSCKRVDNMKKNIVW